MPDWITLGRVDDFRASPRSCVSAGAIPVLVLNLDGELRAIANVCPHAGLPLTDGELRGKVIRCPFHGYAFNVETGLNIDFPDIEPPVATYALRVVDGLLQMNPRANPPPVSGG